MENFENKKDNRIVDVPAYPKSIILESLVLFFGANFMFHQNVFRRVGSRPQFAVFMLVNAFTSHQIIECCNYVYLQREACLFNNSSELKHRVKMNELVRLRMLNQRIF